MKNNKVTLIFFIACLLLFAGFFSLFLCYFSFYFPTFQFDSNYSCRGFALAEASPASSCCPLNKHIAIQNASRNWIAYDATRSFIFHSFEFPPFSHVSLFTLSNVALDVLKNLVALFVCYVTFEGSKRRKCLTDLHGTLF